jgi:hypothetical protein
MPVILVAPYLPLRQPASVGQWRLLPFNQLGETQYLSDEIAADAHLIIGAYRVSGAHLGALIGRGDEPIGADVSPAELPPLHHALLLGMLESNPQRPDNPSEEPSDLNLGHKFAAAENALVYGHPVRGDGTFAIQTGVMAPYLAIHSRIRPEDQVRIKPPGELPTPIMATDLDQAYASAALEVMARDDAVSRRVSRAVDWLDVAWQNAQSLSHDARILALRCGFEVLLSTTEFGDDTWQIRGALAQLLGEPGATRRTRSWEEWGRPKTEDLTDIEWWFQQFTLLRNTIAHGRAVRPEDVLADDGRAHLYVGERELRRALKRTISREGYPEVEEDLLTRAIRRLLNKQEGTE